MDVSLDGARANEESFRLARSLAVPLEGAHIDDGLIDPLTYVPVHNIAEFCRRGGKILFAGSYSTAVRSDYASERRGYPLSSAAVRMYQEFDDPRRPVYGLYDAPLDALVFSNALAPKNHERLVLHEFGHAMTVNEWSSIAHQRSDLLFGLPEQIDDLLRNYAAGDSPNEIRERVLEVLAEAYVWALVGRFAELPGRLSAIIQGVLAGTEGRA